MKGIHMSFVIEGQIRNDWEQVSPRLKRRDVVYVHEGQLIYQ